jgi:hypothetical protein
MCNTIYIVPGGTAAGRPPEEPEEAWCMKTPEGQVYGPVDRTELERWLSEGRISADCQLRSRQDAPWRRADDYFGVLSPRPSPPGQRGGQNPFAANGPAGSPDSSAARGAGYPAARRFQVPHRGGMILVLGILGWVFTCPVFSLMAWAMGSSDLREMRNGRMDSSGMGLTQAGHILGMIYTVLWLIICVIGVFVILMAVVAEAF